jgi:hypothetical protein
MDEPLDAAVLEGPVMKIDQEPHLKTGDMQAVVSEPHLVLGRGVADPR